ncbi:uncharacterized protein TM35_000461510 [Trypanosoma theileri]|uniref:Uncharacterized protein n=1 Tax=Trypanosoma theileri TaxID=67003 RepID=A0A1X0NHU3_9TRYP|nr:uncharacterized protein TM35_000461510 [Trypanosoma theileri]ORC84332.1 hypothetical protein TM35_000461510 [Trypanosoma theileri]
MFSRREVDALFGDAARVLQRSQLLLDERTPHTPSPSTSHSQTYISTSTSAHAHTHTPYSYAASHSYGVLPPSPSLEAALRGLRRLADADAFLDATNAVARRLRDESQRPTAAMQKRRRHRRACPLLRRVVDGLAHVQHEWRSADNTPAGSVWADAAPLAQSLLLAGLFADLAHTIATAAATHNAMLQEMTTSGELPTLHEPHTDELLDQLCRARAGLPEEDVESMDAQIVRVICNLPKTELESVVPSEISALLLFPSLIPYIVLHVSPTLTDTNILKPVERAATKLLPMYLNENFLDFRRASKQLVQHVVLIGVYVALGQQSMPSWGLQRVIGFTKQLFDAFLIPVETAFASSLPRAGVTEDVREGVAEPLCRLARSWIQWEKKNDSSTTCTVAGAKVLLPLWCTASYRALIVVESLAHAELGVVSGRGNATVQQKKYYSMLQQSNGKVTTAILSAVTEDRQLLYEETTARSTHGHKVFRIHEGTSGPSVFVYLDNGTVYMKVGRERVFRRAKSVEDVFSVFVSTTP